MGDLSGFGGIWRTLVGPWEKNLIFFFYICIWNHTWVETGQDGRFTCLQRNVEDAGGTVGKKFYYFIFVFVFLFRSVFGFEDGGKRASAGQGGVEEGSRTCQEGSMTIEDE